MSHMLASPPCPSPFEPSRTRLGGQQSPRKLCLVLKEAPRASAIRLLLVTLSSFSVASSLWRLRSPELRVGRGWMHTQGCSWTRLTDHKAQVGPWPPPQRLRARGCPGTSVTVPLVDCFSRHCSRSDWPPLWSELLASSLPETPGSGAAELMQ